MFLGCSLKKLFLFIIFSSLFLIKATASELNAETKIEIKAFDKLEWHQLENKIVAYGHAVVKSSFFSCNKHQLGLYSTSLKSHSS